MATSFSDSALIIPVIVSSRVSPHPPLLYKYLQRRLINQLFSFSRILVVPLPLPLPHIDRNEFDTSRRDPRRSSPNTAKFPQMRGPLTDHHAAIAVARLVSLIRPEKKKRKRGKLKEKKKAVQSIQLSHIAYSCKVVTQYAVANAISLIFLFVGSVRTRGSVLSE